MSTTTPRNPDITEPAPARLWVSGTLYAPGAFVCGWFAGCGRQAVTFTGHPVLGWVPTCKSCTEFAARKH